MSDDAFAQCLPGTALDASTHGAQLAMAVVRSYQSLEARMCIAPNKG